MKPFDGPIFQAVEKRRACPFSSPDAADDELPDSFYRDNLLYFSAPAAKLAASIPGDPLAPHEPFVSFHIAYSPLGLPYSLDKLTSDESYSAARFFGAPLSVKFDCRAFSLVNVVSYSHGSSWRSILFRTAPVPLSIAVRPGFYRTALDVAGRLFRDASPICYGFSAIDRKFDFGSPLRAFESKAAWRDHMRAACQFCGLLSNAVATCRATGNKAVDSLAALLSDIASFTPLSAPSPDSTCPLSARSLPAAVSSTVYKLFPWLFYSDPAQSQRPAGLYDPEVYRWLTDDLANPSFNASFLPLFGQYFPGVGGPGVSVRGVPPDPRSLARAAAFVQAVASFALRPEFKPLYAKDDSVETFLRFAANHSPSPFVRETCRKRLGLRQTEKGRPSTRKKKGANTTCAS